MVFLRKACEATFELRNPLFSYEANANLKNNIAFLRNACGNHWFLVKAIVFLRTQLPPYEDHVVLKTNSYFLMNTLSIQMVLEGDSSKTL